MQKASLNIPQSPKVTARDARHKPLRGESLLEAFRAFGGPCPARSEWIDGIPSSDVDLLFEEIILAKAPGAGSKKS